MKTWIGLAMGTVALISALGGASAVAQEKEPSMIRFYVGTYTGPASEGIYLVDLDPATGKLSEPKLAAKTKNPSFIALHPTKPLLYAALEIGEFEGEKTGAVQAFSIDAETGMLSPLNATSSTGPGPCYVSVDPSGRSVLVANYGGGNVAALKLDEEGTVNEAVDGGKDQHEGSGPDPRRQKKAFAHSFLADPTGKFALSADLGTDEVIVYALDAANGKIERHGAGAKLAPGAGPRHIAFHPGGKFIFVNGEMNSTVTPMSWNAETGELRPHAPASTLPPMFVESTTTAEIAVHPNGKFVYCSNRGHDSIAVFVFDEASGSLTPIGHTPTEGKSPRHFAIDPSGRFLVAANQKSDSLVSFRIDDKTGRLSPAGSTVKIGAACCVKFVQ